MKFGWIAALLLYLIVENLFPQNFDSYLEIGCQIVVIILLFLHQLRVAPPSLIAQFCKVICKILSHSNFRREMSGRKLEYILRPGDRLLMPINKVSSLFETVCYYVYHTGSDYLFRLLLKRILIQMFLN